MEVRGHLCTLATVFSGKVPALATEQETGWAALCFVSFLAVVSHSPQHPVCGNVCQIMGSICGQRNNLV